MTSLRKRGKCGNKEIRERPLVRSAEKLYEEITKKLIKATFKPPPAKPAWFSRE